MHRNHVHSNFSLSGLSVWSLVGWHWQWMPALLSNHQCQNVDVDSVRNSRLKLVLKYKHEINCSSASLLTASNQISTPQGYKMAAVLKKRALAEYNKVFQVSL